MNKLPLFSEISVSGAQLLSVIYDSKPITPTGLIEVIIFNLYIVANEYRQIYGESACDDQFADSFELLLKDLSLHMPLANVEGFFNDRMQLYHKEYLKISQETNPVSWDVVYYLFYMNPLGESPSSIHLLKSNYIELVHFAEAMLSEIKFMKEVVRNQPLNEV